MAVDKRRLSRAAALAGGRAAAETEIRARSVRYVADRESIEIVTTCHAGFLIPLNWIAALRDLPAADMAKLQVWPDGSAIELEDRDIHISVDGLVKGLLLAILPAKATADLARQAHAGGIDFDKLARDRAALGLTDDGSAWSEALDNSALSRRLLGLEAG
jgi:hypothetical protein